MNGRQIAILAILGAAIFGGAFAGVSKRGLVEIPPFSFTFLRLVIASLFVLPFFLRRKENKLSDLTRLTPISLLATGNVVFFIIGVSLTVANAGSLVYAAVPLLVAVILFLFYKERIARQKEVGILLGFLGVLLIALLPLFEKSNPFSGNLLGNFFLILAIISWSFYNVFSQKMRHHYSPFLFVCGFIFISTVATFPLFVWDIINHPGWWQQVTSVGILSLLYAGIFATIINYLCIQYAIKYGGAVIATTMFYLMPLFGFVTNFILLGEILTPGFIFGSILALLGTYLVVRK